jgi:hypothetical protein
MSAPDVETATRACDSGPRSSVALSFGPGTTAHRTTSSVRKSVDSDVDVGVHRHVVDRLACNGECDVGAGRNSGRIQDKSMAARDRMRTRRPAIRRHGSDGMESGAACNKPRHRSSLEEIAAIAGRRRKRATREPAVTGAIARLTDSVRLHPGSHCATALRHPDAPPGRRGRSRRAAAIPRWRARRTHPLVARSRFGRQCHHPA